MGVVIIYWTSTGNTEKVALTIKEGLSDGGANVSIFKVEDAGDIDFYAFNLYGFNSPKLAAG